MKKLSLQLKITLLCTAMLVISCVLLSVASIYSGKTGFYAVAQQASVVISDYELIRDPNLIMSESEETSTAVFRPEELELADKSSALDTLEDEMAAITMAVGRQFNFQTIGWMILIILIGTLGIYLIVSRLTRPLRQLSTSIGSLDEGNLSVRLEEDGIREVADLSRSLNQMISKLDEAFERQKRFTADAAHELKTPLAAIQVNLDSLRQDEEFTAEEAAEVLQVTQRNIRRLNQLAENLLQLNSTQTIEKNQKCSLHDLFCTILEELDPLIAQKQLKLQLEESYPCLMSEPTLLLRCLYNCVENAVKYAPEEAELKIGMEKQQDQLQITIANPAEEITSLQCEQLFQPFFRLDASRSRKLGGSGLGLAITREIVTRLGGSIEATWSEGWFIIRILL